MKNLYSLLNEKIKKALDDCNYTINSIDVLESNRKDLGEYQFNGAMSLAKEYHKNPNDIANNIANILKKDSFFKDVNVASPGFINMTISDEALIEYINDIDFTYPNKDELIFLDYGGANVAKSLHVGHLRSANIGEALNRLCKFLGYKTISDTHLGDWGKPLGLVILELKKRNPEWSYFDENHHGEYEDVLITNKMLEEIYPFASNKSKEDEGYLKEALEMTVKLQNHTKGIYDLWKKIMEVSLKDIKKNYDRLNANFDLYFGESNEEEYIPLVLDHLNKIGALEDSNGAKVINVSEENDKLEIPPMLIIKSDGGVLYGTTELATIYDRIHNYNPDKIWYIVDKRQELHFTQSFRAAYKTKIADKDKTELFFAGFGTMNGSDGKPFKTRDGGVMKLTDLLDLVKEECLKKLNPNVIDNRDEIAETIAISAIKFADMLPNRESDYVFDVNKFSELEGKTGPYILYSTVRIKSLLDKAKNINISYNKIYKLKNEYDRDIILTISNLDKVLNSAFNAKSLNDITEYLYRLITNFNRFYENNYILKESDTNMQESWLYLTNIVYKVSLILLDILAIRIPEKM